MGTVKSIIPSLLYCTEARGGPDSIYSQLLIIIHVYIFHVKNIKHEWIKE
jgi:hypothetical protein